MREDVVRRGTVYPEGPSDALATASGPDELPVHEFLGFTLAQENYAFPLRSVREILKIPPVTEVPRAPEEVLGIISVRGQVTTVFDLRRLLRMREDPTTKQARILLLDCGEEIIGVLVDSVIQVYRLREDEVELAASLGGDMADYVFGIGRPTEGRAEKAPEEPMLIGRERVEEEILILLDPYALLKRW